MSLINHITSHEMGLYIALAVLIACAIAVRSMSRQNSTLRAAARSYGLAGNSIRSDLDRVAYVLNEASGGLAQRACDLEHLRARMARHPDPVALSIVDAQLTYLKTLAEAAGPHLGRNSRLWLIERPTASVLVQRDSVVAKPSMPATAHEPRSGTPEMAA